MENTCKLYAAGFESSSGTTPEFLAFVRTFKREFIAGLKARGCSKFEIHRGHFYVSGFFTDPAGLPVYFSSDDVRHSITGSLLIRRARDYRDYTGGRNFSVPFAPDMLAGIDFARLGCAD